MEDAYSRNSHRERILWDLKNIIKQIYHESAKHELSPENRTYICLTLVKNLDETLCYGLKQLYLGYWKPICEVLHPQTLQAVEQLPVSNQSECNSLMKGRAWIALSLKDDSFINYIQCFINEGCLERFYEDWSILRFNDACNSFLSILSGLENVKFYFDVDYVNKPLVNCNLELKLPGSEECKFIPLNLKGSKGSIDLGTSSSSLTSPVDSGVHTQDSSSDMEQFSNDKEFDIDLLNGNVPPDTVLRRKHKKNAKRHVSFHEDIINKSSEKCRKLKWDSENLRYSWSGEEIDSSILKEKQFIEIKPCENNNSNTPLKGLNMNERGTPEGEETPSEIEQLKNKQPQKSVIVKRFLLSIKNQSKVKHQCKRFININSNLKNFKIDQKLINQFNVEIENELKQMPKVQVFKNEVQLNPLMIKDMIRNQSVYKAYKLRDYLFIITDTNIYLINKNLEMKRINLKNYLKIVVYPDSHAFSIYEYDNELHTFITGDAELTNEVLGKLEFLIRRNQLEFPQFYFLDYNDFKFVKNNLAEKLVVDKKDDILYCGAVHLDKENDLTNSILPNSKRGFLMYRFLQGGDGWIPGDFCLRNGVLYLFGDDTNLPKLAINIATGCQSCNRTKNPDRPHTFQITLIDGKFDSFFGTNSLRENSQNKQKSSKSESHKIFSGFRQKVNKIWTFGSSKNSSSIIEFAAANDYELSEWFQMIIQASCGDSCEEAHKENLVEGTLWLTQNSLIITNEIWWFNSEIDIISCARLRDIAAFKIGECEKDFFTVIEFICMEANSTSGDWILYLNSREELNKLTAKLKFLWKSKEKFPCYELEKGILLNRCKKSQESISDNYWSLLLLQ